MAATYEARWGSLDDNLEDRLVVEITVVTDSPLESHGVNAAIFSALRDLVERLDHSVPCGELSVVDHD